MFTPHSLLAFLELLRHCLRGRLPSSPPLSHCCCSRRLALEPVIATLCSELPFGIQGEPSAVRILPATYVPTSSRACHYSRFTGSVGLLVRSCSCSQCCLDRAAAAGLVGEWPQQLAPKITLGVPTQGGSREGIAGALA